MQIEKRIRRRDGSAHWIMASISLVRDPDGTPLYSVAQWEDIGDRKRVQAELERMLALERIHVERLRTLDKVKDEFVAGASHELRTPLTSIQGTRSCCSTARRAPLNDDQRAYLLTIHRNGERLERLVDDLLFAARADAGKLELTLAEVDLEQLVLESVESARPAAEQSEIRLECSTSRCRRSRRRRPALAAARQPRVERDQVHAGRRARGGHADGQRRSAVIDVSDTGIGIPAGERGRLFERFFRSTLATERAIQGTGLGLSITKDIAESHGGRIDCESTEGKGTTFRVELPFAGEPEKPNGPHG